MTTSQRLRSPAQRRPNWTAATVRQHLATLHDHGQDVSYTGLARSDGSLLHAAIRLFGRYRQALEAAGLDPKKVRRPVGLWTREVMLRTLTERLQRREPVNAGYMQRHQGGFFQAAVRVFGNYNNALGAAGIDRDKICRRRLWRDAEILDLIRQDYGQGLDISIQALDRRRPYLRAVATHHFGSYEKAVRAAGIDYAKVRHFRWWTDAELIAGLQKLYRQGQDLQWSALTKAHGPLIHSAVARFGNYSKALHAAGIPYDNGIRRYRKEQVLAIIRKDHQAGRDIRISQIMYRHKGLVSGAERHFGSYRRALEAMGIVYPPVKPLPYWTWPKVLKTLQRLYKTGVDLRYEDIQRTHQALYVAACYYWGQYHRAVDAAGIDYRTMCQKQTARSGRRARLAKLPTHGLAIPPQHLPRVVCRPETIRAHRLKLGLSHPQYAQLMGVTVGTVFRWESGRSGLSRENKARWAFVHSLGKREVQDWLGKPAHSRLPKHSHES